MSENILKEVANLIDENEVCPDGHKLIPILNEDRILFDCPTCEFTYTALELKAGHILDIECGNCGHKFFSEFSYEPMKNKYVCPKCEALNC